MKYSVDDKVVITDSGKTYTDYYDWVSDNELHLKGNNKLRILWSRYIEALHDNYRKDGTKLTVVACGCHAYNNNLYIYLCEDDDGYPVLIAEDGLDYAKRLDWRELKLGDVIKNSLRNMQCMVTGIDSTDDTITNHIFAGNTWINDRDLKDYWEKVEA